MISKETADRSLWGDACEAWTLLSNPTLHVMQERMPPGTSEVPHVHERVRQFYFVLAGTATVEVSGRNERLGPRQGTEVEPRAVHRLRNDSQEPSSSS
jgi:mannose-6-phosphate isomerase-like protein (cupin superfamily)